MPVRVTQLPWPSDLIGTVRALRDPRHPFAWLDDARAEDAAVSLVAVEPLLVVQQQWEQAANLISAAADTTRHACGWTLWQQTDRLAPAADHDGPVGPGWLGYVGFEQANLLERLPNKAPDPLNLPQLQLGYYPDVFRLDHRRGLVELLSTPETPWDAGRRSVEEWTHRWCDACEKPTPSQTSTATPILTWDWSEDEYVAAIQRVLAYIAAGDIYQANIAQRGTLQKLGDPLENFFAIRAANPAEYGALIAWDDAAVLSHSPELFLSSVDDNVLTSPIKGTRPRGSTPTEDAANIADLLASEKEAAELAMIVDLHRNDLGRACRPGSVRVTAARRVETHPSVIHTVADVIGTLSPGQRPLDLLKVCFPAGSISGVPKIRALEIIAELEPCTRGAYTGAVLNLTCGAALQANVAIRTLQQRGSEGALWFGGGIVADSDPHAEFAETFAKAGGILRGLGHPGH